MRPAQRLRSYIGTTLAGFVLLVFLASCSVSGVSTGGAPQAATYTNTSQATQLGDRVRIVTDHSTYRPNEPIDARVVNTLGRSIFALDTRASCSILGIEWQTNGQWEPAQGAECPLGRMAVMVEIQPGATYQAVITAGFPGLRAANFPPGAYRLTLTYSLDQLEPGGMGTSTTIYSAALTIAGTPLPPISTEPTIPIITTVTLYP